LSQPVDVLILTSDLDFATDLVCLELGKRGLRYLRLNRENLPDLALALDPVSPRLRCGHENREWLVDSAHLRSIWWRVGTFDRNLGGQPIGLEEQLGRTQWSAFLRSMMVFADAHWVNHPAATYAAETKALQLGVARALGFDVPETMMANDPAALAERNPRERIALKSIDTLLLQEADEQLFGYTTLLEAGSVALGEMHQAPVTIQAPLEPKLDLRVTVIGNRVWCTEIRGQGEPIDGDWRLTQKQDLEYPTHNPPPIVIERCRALVKRLGLVFGAIDLALVDDCYWFIEINPTGEWGWLEGPDRTIAAAIAEELAC